MKSTLNPIFVVCSKFSVAVPVPELSFLPAPYRGGTWAGEKKLIFVVCSKFSGGFLHITAPTEFTATGLLFFA